MTGWLGLTLLCAFSLAAADTLTKRDLSGLRPAQLVVLRTSLPGLLLLPLLGWHWPGWPAAPFWAWVGVAMPLELLAMWLYMFAIRRSPLSLTLPYLAFTPVFTTAAGALLLGETVSQRGLAGILLVVLGAYGLNLDQARAGSLRSWLAPFVAIGREPGSRAMLGVALIYGLTSVLGKGAMQYLPANAFGPLYFVLLGGLALLVFGLQSPASLAPLRHPGRAGLAVGGLMAVMVTSHFLALEQVETAYMIAVKRTSILFGLIFGAWVFREAHLARNLMAAGLMVLGVALILLA